MGEATDQDREVQVELNKRLIRWHRDRERKGVTELPDGLRFNDLESAWEVWRILNWIDWRWPPDVILRQPAALMDDIATLQWYSGIVKDSMIDGGVGTKSAAIQS